MQAIQLAKPHEVRIIEKEIPEPKEGEVRIAVKYLGLCGSDLHMYHGTYGSPHKYPVIPGHEWSGVVEKLGSNIESFKVGDRVTGDAAMWCGVCPNCAKDKNMCIDINKRGLTIDGYASEKIILNQKHLYHIPENVDYPLASINEAFAVSMHAIHRGMGDKPEDVAEKKVLILGGGPLGMGIAMLLIRHFGFSKIYVDDISEFRKNFAVTIGAKKFQRISGETNGSKSYREMYEINGYDFIFESTGVKEVLDNAFLYVNPLGTIVSLAPIPDIQLRGGLLVLKSVRLTGSLGGTGDFESVLAAFAEEPDYYGQIISHCFEMSQIKEAFEAQNADPKRMKILLRIS